MNLEQKSFEDKKTASKDICRQCRKAWTRWFRRVPACLNQHLVIPGVVQLIVQHFSPNCRILFERPPRISVFRKEGSWIPREQQRPLLLETSGKLFFAARKATGKKMRWFKQPTGETKVREVMTDPIQGFVLIKTEKFKLFDSKWRPILLPESTQRRLESTQHQLELSDGICVLIEHYFVWLSPLDCGSIGTLDLKTGIDSTFRINANTVLFARSCRVSVNGDLWLLGLGLHQTTLTRFIQFNLFLRNSIPTLQSETYKHFNARPEWTTVKIHNFALHNDLIYLYQSTTNAFPEKAEEELIEFHWPSRTILKRTQVVHQHRQDGGCLLNLQKINHQLVADLDDDTMIWFG